MSRGGKPEAEQLVQLELNWMPLPAKDDNLNEELCRVLCYLEHPSVVSKTIALMKTTKAKIPDYDVEVMKRHAGYGGKILGTMKQDVTPNVLNIHFLFA